MILSRKDEQWECALPEEAPEKPPIRVPNKHIIPADAIMVNKELGTGEFGVVQQGVWTNDGERVRVSAFIGFILRFLPGIHYFWYFLYFLTPQNSEYSNILCIPTSFMDFQCYFCSEALEHRVQFYISFKY